MPKPLKPYTVSDTRRFSPEGARREPPGPAGIPSIQFSKIDRPIRNAFTYVRAQLEHLPAPAGSHMHALPPLLRGFVMSTQQLYDGMLALLNDKRPTPLLVAASVLTRALVEGLGNLLALVEEPSCVDLFLRDGFRQIHQQAQCYSQRFGLHPNHKKQSQELDEFAHGLKLAPEEIADPDKRIRTWPAPTKLLERKSPPCLSGERRQVFEDVYSFWYGQLSALAHHKLAALRLALYTDAPSDESTFTMLKSTTATLAALVALCVLSETEARCQFPPSPDLRVAWEHAHPLDEIIKNVYKVRYVALLGVTSIPGPGVPP